MKDRRNIKDKVESIKRGIRLNEKTIKYCQEQNEELNKMLHVLIPQNNAE